MRDVEDAVPYKSGEIDQPLSSRIEMKPPHLVISTEAKRNGEISMRFLDAATPYSK